MAELRPPSEVVLRLRGPGHRPPGGKATAACVLDRRYFAALSRPDSLPGDIVIWLLLSLGGHRACDHYSQAL